MPDIERMYAALREIEQTTTKHIAISQVDIFLYLCLNPGVDVYKMSEELGIIPQSISRNAKELTRYIIRDDKGEKVWAGYNLLTADKDPENLRRVIYHLTPKGKVLRDKLQTILNQEE